MAFQHLAMAPVCQGYIHTLAVPLHRVPLLQLALHLCSGVARVLLNQSLQPSAPCDCTFAGTTFSHEQDSRTPPHCSYMEYISSGVHLP